MCCVQIAEVADLISLGQAHNRCAISACMLVPSGALSCCISDTYRLLSYVEIEGLARDAVE
jgi:hypothetical protein